MINKIKSIFSKTKQEYYNPLYDGKIRNEPCVCFSGKKLKNCHGSKMILTEQEMKEHQTVIKRFVELAKKS